MLFEINSVKPLSSIDEGLRAAAVRHQFGVLTVHDLKETMSQKGVDLAIDCRIYEVCNPRQAKRVLETNGAISSALPCRISVYGSEGRYTISTIRPTALITMFGDKELEPVAKEVEDVVVAMMRESA